MNKQGPGKIDWCDYSWNPISGCLHGCKYCYMRRMEKRFPGIMDPKFHPKRLSQAKTLKNPSLIFVGSSGDMWGDFIPSEWINKVLEMCKSSDRHIFLFLTKNPRRYAEFPLLPNCWYGTTDDGTERTENNIRDLVNAVSTPRRFVSFEPLLHRRTPDLTGVQWIIIGADSTRGAKKPPKEWADTLIALARFAGIPVFVKDNYGYGQRIKETP